MKSELKQELARLEAFENPKVSLEQYMTPPELASDILHTAAMQEDVGEEARVVDLGTGTGIFAVGSALLGSEVVAVEKDPEALEIAGRNSEKTGVREAIRFVESDIRDFQGSFDTCLMNPPFSVHSGEGLKFFETAFDVARRVYSVVYGGRKKGIKDFVEHSNHEIRDWQSYSIELPPTHGFHTEEGEEVEIGVLVAGKGELDDEY